MDSVALTEWQLLYQAEDQEAAAEKTALAVALGRARPRGGRKTMLA